MKKDVVSKGEIVGEAVRTDNPAFCNARLNLQGGIQFYQAVVQLAAGPDDALVFGESGVEGGDAGTLIVAEYHLVLVTVAGAGCEEEDEYGKNIFFQFLLHKEHQFVLLSFGDASANSEGLLTIVGQNNAYITGSESRDRPDTFQSTVHGEQYCHPWYDRQPGQFCHGFGYTCT